jgi:hypothetical protein
VWPDLTVRSAVLDQRQFRPSLFERLSIRWRRMMHDSPMWPIRGHYRCRTCGRRFPVQWASEAADRVRIWVRPKQRVARRAA